MPSEKGTNQVGKNAYRAKRFHIGFYIGDEENKALRQVRNIYHVSTSDLFRLYLVWLGETNSVPIGLPGSVYEIARDPRSD